MPLLAELMVWGGVGCTIHMSVLTDLGPAALRWSGMGVEVQVVRKDERGGGDPWAHLRPAGVLPYRRITVG